MLQNKTQDFSEIRTGNIRVGDEHHVDANIFMK